MNYDIIIKATTTLEKNLDSVTDAIDKANVCRLKNTADDADEWDVINEVTLDAGNGWQEPIVIRITYLKINEDYADLDIKARFALAKAIDTLEFTEGEILISTS